ncbi:replicative DNA helicase [Xylocopilactobacillus apicola]|uniref:Replicative DNA helicase n=1 Tax=Xylocopilactobacillus apicola TaxID=2932184 RepID=A0AAU9CZE6_9LACO|nr:replicative DNA helicase [Xylocopilactobacillus apicola]BDR57801.1 replicative DNA helicase [Xylocopilactobacillus apicola]
MNDNLTSLPNSPEAEQGVLGGIFIDPNRYSDALSIIEPSDFYDRKNQIIFQTMIDLVEEDQTIDVLVISDRLADQHQLENIGGTAYLAQLAERTPIARNVQYYANIVSEKSKLRRLIQTARDIISQAFQDSDQVEQVIEDAQNQILEIDGKRNGAGFQKISDILKTSFEHIEEMSKNDSRITGLTTGYHYLDQLTNGLHPDELIILAARPSMGKTAFALNIAQNVAVQTKSVVAIFSLEMSAESLVNRMICAEGNISANNLQTGNLTAEEWEKLTVAMNILGQTNVYIDDTPGNRIAEIRSKCKKLAQEVDDIGLIVVDYLQLIEGKGENRQQEISQISRQLKKLAKELAVPVIALSQLSRSVEQRQDKRPILSDIRESGSIEQDADIVAFLYRDDYYGSEDSEDGEENPDNVAFNQQDVVKTEVIVSKNRAGALGTVNLMFKKSYNKFLNLAMQEESA